MKYLLKSLLLFTFSGLLLLTSCHQSKEKIGTLRFSDSLFIDTLVNYMISENMVELHENNNKVDFFQTYIAYDYLTDSMGNVFYVEVESGTCGNSVYIIDKTNDVFKVLYTENCVEVNTDIEHNDVEGGYRVIYINKPEMDGLYKIVYDGSKFQTLAKETATDLTSK